METNEILKLVNLFKLGNSIYKGQYQIVKDYEKSHNLSKEDLENIYKEKISIKIANLILNNNSNKIEVIEDQDFKTFYLELFVFAKDEFKMIVDSTIRSLSDEQIFNIRNN